MLEDPAVDMLLVGSSAIQLGNGVPLFLGNCVKEGNCFKFLEQQRHLIPYASYFTLKLTDHLRSWNAINNAAAHEVVRNVSV